MQNISLPQVSYLSLELKWFKYNLRLSIVESSSTASCTREPFAPSQVRVINMFNSHCEMVKEAFPPGGPLEEVVDVPLQGVLHPLLGLALQPRGLQGSVVVSGV